MKKKLFAILLTAAMLVSVLAVPGIGVSAAEDTAGQTLPYYFPNHDPGQIQRAEDLVEVAENVAAMQIGVPDAFINFKKTFIDTNNKKVVPMKKSGKTLIPLRFCASSMGGTAKYISDKDYITVKVGDMTAKFKINSKKLQIVGADGKVKKEITMEVAATKVNGRVMVPVRAISEGLGCKVFYKKVGKGEFVVVSMSKLTNSEYNYQIALLQNLKTYVFTSKAKTYKLNMPASWKKYDEADGVYAFNSPLYANADLLLIPLSVADGEWYVKATESQLKEFFAYQGVEVSNYYKLTIKGKKAVFFTLEVPDGNDTYYYDACVISSKNTALVMQCDYLGTKYRNEFKRIFKSVTMLK